MDYVSIPPDTMNIRLLLVMIMLVKFVWDQAMSATCNSDLTT